MTQPPKIDPEFAALLPPLTREEFTDLEMKVSVEEFREPLVVWKETGTLLDGHHRLKICDKYKIQYFTKEISFPSRERAIQWVIDNQLARRNLTDERRAYYRGKEYLAKKQQHVGQTVSDGQNDHPGQTVSQALAQKHGVGEKTIRRDAEFAQAIDQIGATDPAKKEAILSGTSGLTKQQVTNATNPQILCDRCRRVGAVQGCKACDEAR
jgi:ParB-like chromosome segregation protein Spo0J